MGSLTDVYNQISSHDAAKLEKRAAVELERQAIEKQAQEEEYAGRIMARGFADELHKLAQEGMPKPIGVPGGTVKSQGFGGTPAAMTGGGAMAPRTPKAPPTQQLAAGQFSRGQGGYGGSNLSVTSGALASKRRPVGGGGGGWDRGPAAP